MNSFLIVKVDKCGKNKHDAISRKLSKAQEKVWGMLKAEFMKWLFRSALLISLAFNWGITVRTTIQTILTLTRNTRSDLWTSRTLKICHYHNPWVTKPVPCPLLNHWLYFWIVVRVFRAQLGLTWVWKIQVWPCLSVKDIDEQCKFPQSPRWAIRVSTILT